jgi:DNA polymerase III subunit gamma/tau
MYINIGEQMAQALYRKYRSKSFDEIVGQKNVVKALKNAVVSNLISHAYLFTGPRGVGKTSIARILAYAITESSYESDELPLDIIEIDAASNRGIEEIRDLREKVMMAPVRSKRKVYIIDEVHMLTTHAFNALLKTLEEPPKHVVFILATTESHKVPETITSRTQRFNFTLASPKEVTAHLNKISKKENITISDDALMTIARHSGGSMRDALSALDHVRHMSDKITDDLVRAAIGIPDSEHTESIINAIEGNNAPQIITLINKDDSNAALIALSKDLVTEIMNRLQKGTINIPLNKINQLLQQLLPVETSSQPRSQLVVALLSAIEEKPNYNGKTNLNQKVESLDTNLEEPKKTIINANEPKINNENVINSESPVRVDNTIQTGDIWPKVLEDIRSTYNTLYSVLRMINYDKTGNVITMECKFDFHRKRISESKNKEIISKALSKYMDDVFELNIVTVSSKKQLAPENEAVDNDIAAIRMVFNKAEPLEY